VRRTRLDRLPCPQKRTLRESEAIRRQPSIPIRGVRAYSARPGNSRPPSAARRRRCAQYAPHSHTDRSDSQGNAVSGHVTRSTTGLLCARHGAPRTGRTTQTVRVIGRLHCQGRTYPATPILGSRVKAVAAINSIAAGQAGRLIGPMSHDHRAMRRSWHSPVMGSRAPRGGSRIITVGLVLPIRIVHSDYCRPWTIREGGTNAPRIHQADTATPQDDANVETESRAQS
jgi:hypothetical protein